MNAMDKDRLINMAFSAMRCGDLAMLNDFIFHIIENNYCYDPINYPIDNLINVVRDEKLWRTLLSVYAMDTPFPADIFHLTIVHQNIILFNILYKEAAKVSEALPASYLLEAKTCLKTMKYYDKDSEKTFKQVYSLFQKSIVEGKSDYSQDRWRREDRPSMFDAYVRNDQLEFMKFMIEDFHYCPYLAELDIWINKISQTDRIKEYLKSVKKDLYYSSIDGTIARWLEKLLKPKMEWLS